MSIFNCMKKEIRKYFRIAFSHVCCVIGLKKCASLFYQLYTRRETITNLCVFHGVQPLMLALYIYFEFDMALRDSNICKGFNYPTRLLWL